MLYFTLTRNTIEKTVSGSTQLHPALGNSDRPEAVSVFGIRGTVEYLPIELTLVCLLIHHCFA